jgi:8-amino-7-oxononanoate synthase
VSVGGRELISFGTKDYLGLAHDPRVKEAAIKALERFGTSVSGSRAMNGTHTLHEQLEHDLASFKRTETAVVYALGYLTNVGMLTALLGKSDVAFLDERAHGSIFDGCRYSGAKIIMFRHNSVEDLRAKIRWARASRCLIVVDGVYSVDGDLANLQKIRAVAREEGVPLMVDDAHGVGILGETGAGTTEYFGMLGDVDLDMGTFSAAFGGVGGFVACSKAVGDYLRHFSTGFTFTVGLPAPNIAAVIEALRIIRHEPALRARLWSNVSRFKADLERLGYPISPSHAAVFAIRTGDERTTYRLDRALRDHGVYVNSFCRPTVRRGEAILRLSVSAAHTDLDLEKAVEAFRAVRPLLPEKRRDS